MGWDEQEAQARRVAADAVADADPTAWFERLYAAADASGIAVPWARGGPNPLLAEWTAAASVDGAGRRALVVGCGLGDDAEHVAALGFATVAFDIAPSAVEAARRRFPGSPVEYRAADVLVPPADWPGAFDLVVECLTVQSLPDSVRPAAIAAVAAMVAPGGTLLVVATGRDAATGPVDGPPWPLVRAEVDAFAAGALEPVRIERLAHSELTHVFRWRGEFTRPRAG